MMAEEHGMPYYDELMQGEQLEVTESIELLLRQTFILEHKFDKRTGRFQYNRDFRICSKHLEFIRNYFAIGGMEVQEESHMGVIYLQGGTLAGDKLPKLATLYLLVLKLLYDEQMESISTSVNVYTTLREIHEKLGGYRLLRKQPSPTDIRRVVALLKKYQIVEPLDLMEDLNAGSRMIIYPCINVVLMGDDARAILASFEEGNQNDGAQEQVRTEDGREDGNAGHSMTEDEGGEEDEEGFME